jgi:hypothetical protein
MMKARKIAGPAGLLALVLAGMGVRSQISAQQTSTWDKFGPATRYQATAIYDSTSDTMVIFGGQHTTTSQDFSDLWWAPSVSKAECQPPCTLQWNHPSTKVGNIPTARFGHSAVYDSVNTRMIVFAGATGVASPPPCQNDVHILEYATGIGGSPNWITPSPTGTAPAARYSHTAVYDPGTDRMIVFGGNNCSSTYYNDVWVLENANDVGGTPAWLQLSPSGTPPSARAFTSAIYDETSNRMIVFGGFSGTAMNDVWALTNANGVGGTPAWTKLSPGGTAPAARYGHSAVYDSTNNRMIVYGGYNGKTYLGDTWVLTNANGLGGTPAWTLTVAGTGNAPLRGFHTAIYSSATNEMITFSGKLPSNVTGDPSDDHTYTLTNANGL